MGKSRVHFLEYSSGKTAYHTDHLGSSNVITDQDGNLQSRFEYLPYGKTSVDERPSNPESRTNDYRFTGKELDSTGLYYYGARYYDPELGRFITPDSFVQNPFDPQTLNRYTYCRNNPLIYTDPSGNFFGLIIAAIIGAVLGGAMAAATGGDIGRGILFGALGGALTAGVSSAIFSSVAVNTLVGKAAVYAVSAFASSAAVGAMQGVRGSDLWRSAAISAGVAFAATMIIGSISEAAKNTKTTSNPKVAEAGQIKTTKAGTLEGNTIEAAEGSKAAVSESVDPVAGKSVTEIVNNGSGSNTLATASQADKTAAALTTEVASNPSPIAGAAASSSTSVNIFGKIKRTVEWIVWWGGRIFYNWNTAPGSPDVYPPPPGWKPEDWYGVPISTIIYRGG